VLLPFRNRIEREKSEVEGIPIQCTPSSLKFPSPIDVQMGFSGVIRLLDKNRHTVKCLECVRTAENEWDR